MSEHIPSKDDLIAELEAAAAKWVLEKNKYTLECLRDARKAVLATMRPTSETDARLDRAYCDGARQAQAIAHQSLIAMDQWISEGCGNRAQAVKATACPGCGWTSGAHAIECPDDPCRPPSNGGEGRT